MCVSKLTIHKRRTSNTHKQTRGLFRLPNYVYVQKEDISLTLGRALCTKFLYTVTRISFVPLHRSTHILDSTKEFLDEFNTRV